MKIPSSQSIYPIVLVLLLLSACGTTSGIKTSDHISRTEFSLAGYNQLLVGEFTETTSQNMKVKGKTEEIRQRQRQANTDEALNLAESFVDQIITQTKQAGVFDHVGRQSKFDLTDRTIVLDGNVSRFDFGNKTARLLVGFGAGNAAFDCIVKLRDATTNEELGEIVVDKNSWALGGVLGAQQDVYALIESAARKIAKEFESAALR